MNKIAQHLNKYVMMTSSSILQGLRSVCLFFVVIFIGYQSQMNATHIVGGDMTYQCLGNNMYEITLTLRRDCINGAENAPFDDPASLGFFDQYGNPLIHMGTHGQVFIPFVGDDTVQTNLEGICSVLDSPVCVHEAIYKTVIYLPPIDSDYILAYQRCCRNGSLNNIVNPLETGATYFVRIREEGQASCNSGPVFNDWPSIYICVNEELIFDHSAIDSEGDSLVYSLCTPSKGASIEDPQPQPPIKPPFGNVEWTEGFGLDNLMGGIPLEIDPATGVITATPSLVGQYLIGVCVEEYRDDVLLSTTRRDFEYNVAVCLDEPIPDFEVSAEFCGGLTGTFQNLSTGAQSYKWYFDFPNEDPSFISTDTSPVFTFPAAGTYIVRLEAKNSDGSVFCTSILEKEVNVTDGSLEAGFEYVQLICEEDSLTIGFRDTSTESFENAEIISWDWQIITIGDTFSSMLQNPDFKLPMDEVISISLEVQSNTGCTAQTAASKQLSPIFPNDVGFRILNCQGEMFTVELYDASTYPEGVNAENHVWNVTINGMAMMGGGSSIILLIPDSSQVNATLTTDLNNGCTGRAEESFDFDARSLIDIDTEFISCTEENKYAIRVSSSISPFFEGDPQELNWTVIYDGQTLEYSDSDFELELEYGKTLEIKLTVEFDSGCALEKTRILDSGDILGINLAIGKVLTECSDSVLILQLSDQSSLSTDSITLINRNWSIGTAAGNIESSDSTVQIEIVPGEIIQISLSHTYDNGCTFSISEEYDAESPAIIFSPDPIIVCDGQPQPLVLNPDGNYTYTWDPLDGLIFENNEDLSNPTALPDSSTLYKVTISNDQCSITDSVYVYRANDITLEISGNTEICNDLLELSVSGAGDHDLYEWSFSPDFEEIAAVGQHVSLGIQDSASDVYVRILVNSCPAATTSAVILNNTVSLEFLGDPLYACTGSGTFLLANPNSAWQYAWNPQESLSFDSDTDFSNPFASPDTTTTYSVTVTNGNCSEEGMVEVIRFEDYVPEISADFEGCADTVRIEAMGGPSETIFEWSLTEDFDEILATGPSLELVLSPQVQIIFVRAILGDCTSAHNSLNFGDQYVSLEFYEPVLFACTGSGTALVANPNNLWNYEWSPLEGLSFEPEGDFSNPIALPDSTTMYQVTVTNGDCVEEGMVTVYRSEDIVIQISNSSSPCDSVMLLAVEGAPPGTLYEWSVEEDFSEVIAAGDEVSIPIMENMVRIFVRADLGDCPDAISFIDLTNDAVRIEFIDAPLVSCSESGTFIVSNPNSQWQYEWFPAEGLIFKSENDFSNPFVQSGTTGTYYVTVTNGDCSITDSVEVIASEDVNLQFHGNVSICDEIVQLSVTGAEGAQYIWSSSAIFSDTLALGDSLQIIQTEGAVSYFVKGVFDNSCETRVEHTTVNSQAVAVILPLGPVVVCEGDGAPLVLNPNSDWEYTWDPSEGLIFEDTTDLSNPIALPAETTRYSVTVTNGICSDTASVLVSRSEQLELEITGDTITCGETTFLTIANLEIPAIYEWSRDSLFSEIIHTGSILIIEALQSRDTLYARAMSGGCQIAANSIVLQDNTPFTELAGDTLVTCENLPVQLVLNPESNWTYMWEPETGLIFGSETDKSNPTALPDETTSYIVMVSNEECTFQDSVTVILEEDLQVNVLLDSIDCAGIFFVSADSPAANVDYEWSLDSTFQDILVVGKQVQIMAEGPVDIYVRAFNEGCTSPATFLNLDYQFVSLEFLSDPIVICGGIPSKIIANPNPSWSYQWSPAEGLDFSDGESNPSIFLNEAAVYKVTVSDGTCEIADSVAIEVFDDISLQIVGDTISCDGITNLTAETTGGIPAIWSTSSMFSDTLSVSSQLMVEIGNTEALYFAKAIIEGTGCVSNVDSFLVRNQAIIPDSIGIFEICDEDTLQIIISLTNPVDDVVFEWQADPHIISELNQSQIEVVRLEQDEMFTLYYSASNASNCSLSDSVDVIVGERTDSPFADVSQLCGTYQICVTTDAAPGTFRWDFLDEDNVGEEFAFSQDTCYSYGRAGLFEILLNSTEIACGFEEIWQPAHVEEIIVLQSDFTDSVYCEGEILDIEIFTNGQPDSIRWFNSTDSIIGEGLEITYAPSGEETIRAIEYTEFGCGDTLLFELRNYEFDLTIENVETICPGEVTFIEVIDNAGDNLSYSWGPEECILSGSGTANPEIWNTLSKDLILMVTNDDYGCMEERIIPIDVSDFAIDIEVEPPDTMINLSESVELSVLTLSDADAISYMWSTGDNQAIINVTPDETTIYTVIATDEFGCSASDQVTIEVRQPLCNETDVFLPTAFSPNSDGINDVLLVRSNFIESMELVIYDRWGNEVFRTNDINTGWNGRFRNTGHEMASNAYAFSLEVICINALDFVMAGNVTLIR